MADRKPLRWGVGSTIIIVLALIVLALLATRRSRTLVLHQTLQLDDFFFTVVQAAEIPTAATEKNAEGGRPRRLPGDLESRESGAARSVLVRRPVAGLGG
jgi:hypothetical protein